MVGRRFPTIAELHAQEQRRREVRVACIRAFLIQLHVAAQSSTTQVVVAGPAGGGDDGGDGGGDDGGGWTDPESVIAVLE